MSRILRVSLLLILLLSLLIGVAQAQEEGDPRGTIQGVIYEDVNGDGLCVNTGIAEEGPVEGVDIRFTSSDGETILTLQSGPDGIYGMFAAGYSNWRVEVQPGTDWVVSSENPIYAPIYEDSLVQTDVNFCVQKTATATIFLPQSGSAAWPALMIAAILGIGLIAAGLAYEWRRRRQAL